jgi:hypothetical protein
MGISRACENVFQCIKAWKIWFVWKPFLHVIVRFPLRKMKTGCCKCESIQFCSLVGLLVPGLQVSRLKRFQGVQLPVPLLLDQMNSVS